jgi:hypothetical protein
LPCRRRPHSAFQLLVRCILPRARPLLTYPGHCLGGHRPRFPLPFAIQGIYPATRTSIPHSHFSFRTFPQQPGPVIQNPHSSFGAFPRRSAPRPRITDPRSAHSSRSPHPGPTRSESAFRTLPSRSGLSLVILTQEPATRARCSHPWVRATRQRFGTLTLGAVPASAATGHQPPLSTRPPDTTVVLRIRTRGFTSWARTLGLRPRSPRGFRRRSKDRHTGDGPDVQLPSSGNHSRRFV